MRKYLLVLVFVVSLALLACSVAAFSTCAYGSCDNAASCKDSCVSKGTCKCDFLRYCKNQRNSPCGDSCFSSCPNDIKEDTWGGQCYKNVWYDAPDVASSCGEFLERTGPSSGGFFPLGDTTVTFRGSLTTTWSCDFVVTVEDKEKPRIYCPYNYQRDATSSCNGVIIDYRSSVSTRDNCAGETWSVKAGRRWDEPFPVGDTTVVLEVTDTSGNKAQCNFVVSVLDRSPPTLNNCPSDVSIGTDPGVCYAFYDFTPPTASDNCPGTIVEMTRGPTNKIFNRGDTDVTFRATDAAGNTDTCTFTVTVDDGEGPSVLCPPDIVVGNDFRKCSAYVEYPQPFGTDNCFDITLDVADGTTNAGDFPYGVTPQTYTVTDGDGNTNSCTFYITVEDRERPVIDCYGEVRLPDPDADCQTALSPPYPTAVDNCGVIANIFQGSGIPFGTVLPLGSYQVSFNATDPDGNEETCIVVVYLIDSNPPTVVTCPSDISMDSDLGVCGAVVTFPVPTFQDECSFREGISKGFVPGSVFPVGTTVVEYVAVDSSSNTPCTFDVTITDTEPPTPICPVDITIPVEPGVCTAVYRYVAVTAIDNCGIASIVQNSGLTSSQTYSLGTTTNTFTITDVHGLVSTCSFDVTVVDQQNPTIDCPSSLDFFADPGTCTTTVTFSDPSTNENCGSFTLTQLSGPTSGTTLTSGSYPVQYRAMDSNGNTAFCNFNINVIDDSPPILSCPSDLDIYTTANECIDFFDVPDATITDNCPTGSSIVLVKNVTKNSDQPLFGRYIVTQTATDSFGNSASCTQNVNFIDQIPPVLYCKDIIVPLDAGFNASIIVSNVVKKVSDNCGLVPSITLSQDRFTYRDFLSSPVTVVATGLDPSGNRGTCSSTIVVTTIQNIIVLPLPNQIRFIGRSFPIKWVDVGVFNSKSKIDLWLTDLSNTRVLTLTTGYQYNRLQYTAIVLGLPAGPYFIHADVDNTGDGGGVPILLE